jgi:hypothetical protein
LLLRLLLQLLLHLQHQEALSLALLASEGRADEEADRDARKISPPGLITLAPYRQHISHGSSLSRFDYR